MEKNWGWGPGLYGEQLEERGKNQTLPKGMCRLYAPAAQVRIGESQLSDERMRLSAAYSARSDRQTTENNRDLYGTRQLTGGDNASFWLGQMGRMVLMYARSHACRLPDRCWVTYAIYSERRLRRNVE